MTYAGLLHGTLSKKKWLFVVFLPKTLLLRVAKDSRMMPVSIGMLHIQGISAEVMKYTDNIEDMAPNFNNDPKEQKKLRQKTMRIRQSALPHS